MVLCVAVGIIELLFGASSRTVVQVAKIKLMYLTAKFSWFIYLESTGKKRLMEIENYSLSCESWEKINIIMVE